MEVTLAPITEKSSESSKLLLGSPWFPSPLGPGWEASPTLLNGKMGSKWVAMQKLQLIKSKMASKNARVRKFGELLVHLDGLLPIIRDDALLFSPLASLGP